MIKISNLVKIFEGGTRAVDNLSLEVGSGEILALLGPNGAGKSTTIRCLTTLSGFDEGQILVAGNNVDTHSTQVREAIGLVAQQTGVDYFLTGRENLRLFGHLYHLNRTTILARIDELASYFDLTDALDRPVTTYSGGMRRKLDIATALIHRPKILLLDEPTLGLDIHSRKSLWQYINKLNTELGLTILLTTHYLEEADQLAHRVAIIANGSVRVIDTPENLKRSLGGDAVCLAFAQVDTAAQGFAYNMKNTPGVQKALWEGNNLRIYLSDGASRIPELLDLAKAQNVTIDAVTLSRPSLDDVFIQYTGASLNTADDNEGGDEWWKQWAGKDGGKWYKKWQDQQDEEGNKTSATQSTSDDNNNSAPASDAQQWPESGKSDNKQQWPNEQWSNENQGQWPKDGDGQNWNQQDWNKKD